MIKRRYVSLDVLKGIAMLMVILNHYNQKFTSSVALFQFTQMGCQIFFVMSGLGVSFSLAKCFRRGFDFRALAPYYKSRYLRIAPPYYVMMAVVFLANTLLTRLLNRPLAFGSNRSLWGILCNVLFIHGLVPSANNSVMAGGWYIGTSMLLYLIAPFLFAAFRRTKRKKAACLAMSLAPLALLFALTRILPEAHRGYLVDNNSFGYFSILTQLPCFALGMLLYFELQGEKRLHPVLDLGAGAALMAGSAALYFHPFFDFSYIVTASAVGLAAYFIARGLIALERKKRFSYSFPITARFGQKSLYIYLTHIFFAWPFVAFILEGAARFGVQADNYVVYALLFPVVVALSYFSAVLLEKGITAFVKGMTGKE